MTREGSQDEARQRVLNVNQLEENIANAEFRGMPKGRLRRKSEVVRKETSFED